MCKVLTPLEQLSLFNSKYKCLCCTFGEKLNIADINRTKISALIEEEDALHEKVVIARIKCDNLKAQYHCVVGEREEIKLCS